MRTMRSSDGSQLSQQDLLREAMSRLRMTRDAFADRFGLTRRALDTYLLPSGSAEARMLPEVARRYVCEVLWRYSVQRQTCTQRVYILDVPSDFGEASMDFQIDPMLVRFTGERNRRKGTTTVQIVVDGVPRPLPFHLAVANHSPMGFEWGYLGSGAHQLALAMCVELVGPKHALKVYHHVNEAIVGPLTANEWSLTGGEVMEAIDETTAAS